MAEASDFFPGFRPSRPRDNRQHSPVPFPGRQEAQRAVLQNTSTPVHVALRSPASSALTHLPAAAAERCSVPSCRCAHMLATKGPHSPRGRSRGRKALHAY